MKKTRRPPTENEKRWTARAAGAEARRQEQNKLLVAKGYEWLKIDQEWLDDMDDTTTAIGWHLYSPDGREVTPAQALQEIGVIPDPSWGK